MLSLYGVFTSHEEFLTISITVLFYIAGVWRRLHGAGHGHHAVLARQAQGRTRVQNDESHEQVLHHRPQRSATTHQNDRTRTVQVCQDVGEGWPTYRADQCSIGNCFRILTLPRWYSTEHVYSILDRECSTRKRFILSSSPEYHIKIIVKGVIMADAKSTPSYSSAYISR